ncbi:hypothetical protein [Cohnella hongkongensis]|uniref:Mannitol dehydrogenase N-terminal domain-containing protein n=1 Tax=Cohnella hongkongensis TaxID=178337 RepID=A0ABV9FHD7_9BACL
MGDRTVVHFGAGALGRGMVVPLLHESGYNVVLADTNAELNAALNRERGYRLAISDGDSVERKIGIVEAVSPITEGDKLAAYMKQANVITTSVRRENLIHVARTVAETWGHQDGEGRRIICCENIEHVGRYFSGLLEQAAEDEGQHARLRRVAVPDTIVDRICAANWPENTDVVSEVYHECSVDAATLADTGIALIPSVERIEQHFSRKRLLLNTYADAISFLAKAEDLTYLYEAARSEEINRRIEPYMALLQEVLKLEFGCDEAMLRSWREKYKQRLGNDGIPRELGTVARNLKAKLAPGERFVWPLLKLQERGIDIDQGAAFLAHLIRVGTRLEPDSDLLQSGLYELWNGSPAGRQLYEQVRAHLDSANRPSP